MKLMKDDLRRSLTDPESWRGQSHNGEKQSMSEDTWGVDPYVFPLTSIPFFSLVNKTPSVFRDPPSSSEESHPIQGWRWV